MNPNRHFNPCVYPIESVTKPHSRFNPNESELHPGRFFNPIESFSIREYFQISIRINPFQSVSLFKFQFE